MTKDGVGWGAHAGTVAVELAARGFTGSGTVFDEDGVAVTETLGDTHHVTRGYLKPYPCCRWAHPGIDAVRTLAAEEDIDPDAVETVRVHTFEEATHLDTRHPESIEAAEYSYPYAVAVALAYGQVTPAEIRAVDGDDPTVERLAEAVELVVDADIDERFPAECLARVELTADGETYASDVTRPRGSRERPVAPEEREAKIERLCAPALSPGGIERVRTTLTDRSAPIEEVLAPWQ